MATPRRLRSLPAGLGLVALGEGLRLWGVHHIGVISRTRTDRLGPLVASGPFAFVRNPLYIGNITLWAGLALSARLPWLAPIFVLVLAVEYDAIVRWEERLLVERLGDTYREYASRSRAGYQTRSSRRDRRARRDSDCQCRRCSSNVLHGARRFSANAEH